MGLFSTASKDTRIGVDFLPDGVAVAQVRSGSGNAGDLLRAEFIQASGQQAQVEALGQWVQRNRVQKTPCVCLVAQEDCNVYQVERPEVDEAEIIQAVTWKIKDLINYEVASAVVDSYPMPDSTKNNQRQVAVVAAREAVIGGYVDSIRESSLRLDALDIHELVRANLPMIHTNKDRRLALISFTDSAGLLGVYYDTDLYVSREFKIGLGKLEQAGGDDESVFDAMLLEIQRSLDYFESFYGIGPVADLRFFPRGPATEKMAMYLQNLTNYDIDFVSVDGADEGFNPACFHAYCAALRDLQP